MPRPKQTDEQPQAEEEVLMQFTVFINGHDRMVMAKDAKDLEAKIAKIKAEELK